MNFTQRAIAPLVLALVVAGCGSQPAEQEKAEKEEGHAGEEGLIRLTPQQVAAARIEVALPSRGGTGAITLQIDTLQSAQPPSHPSGPRRWYAHLYVQVLAAIALGVLVGHFAPATKGCRRRRDGQC